MNRLEKWGLVENASLLILVLALKLVFGEKYLTKSRRLRLDTANEKKIGANFVNGNLVVPLR